MNSFILFIDALRTRDEKREMLVRDAQGLSDPDRYRAWYNEGFSAARDLYEDEIKRRESKNENRGS